MQGIDYIVLVLLISIFGFYCISGLESISVLSSQAACSLQTFQGLLIRGAPRHSPGHPTSRPSGRHPAKRWRIHPRAKPVASAAGANSFLGLSFRLDPESSLSTWIPVFTGMTNLYLKSEGEFFSHLGYVVLMKTLRME